MGLTLLRGLIAGLVVVGVTELSSRFPRVGALLLTLPLVSILAFYSARNKLGIKSGKRRKKSGKRTVVRKKPATAASVSFDDLQAAAKYLNEVGDADKAIAALKQVKALQIK